MAKREGSGGRGGVATDAPDGFNLDDFAVVQEAEELSRSRVAPSHVQPLIDLAREHLGQKIEKRDVVPVLDDEGNPVYQMTTNDDGSEQAVTDDEGNPVPQMERRPHVYSKSEAEKYTAELRNAATRNRLPARRLSLRIVTDPPMAKTTDSDEIRVQFYIVGRTPNEPQPTS